MNNILLGGRYGVVVLVIQLSVRGAKGQTVKHDVSVEKPHD